MRTTGTLAFTVPSAGVATVMLYDALGREVAMLFDGEVAPGQAYEATVSASVLAPGVYVARLVHSGAARTQTLVVAR